MTSKIVLLIIASQGYQPIEYGLTRQALEQSGISVLIASDKPMQASARPSEAHSLQCSDPVCREVVTRYPQYSTAKVDLTLDQVDLTKIDAVFLIGGPGALETLDTTEVHQLIQQAARSKKLFGAICISPRILAKAGILTGRQVTGWDGDHKLAAILEQHHATYIRQPVVQDGLLITASGPDASQAFAETIVQAITK